MADYIPGPDASFQACQSNVVTSGYANLAALGLAAADTTPITAARSARVNGFTAHVDAVAAAEAAEESEIA